MSLSKCFNSYIGARWFIFVFWWDCGWSPERQEEESPLNISCPKTQTPCVCFWEKPVCSEAAPASCRTLGHGHSYCDVCHGVPVQHAFSGGESKRRGSLCSVHHVSWSQGWIEGEGRILTSPRLARALAAGSPPSPSIPQGPPVCHPIPQPFCSCL